jgi:hypothetical protein
MVTGHRQIAHVETVRKGLHELLTGIEWGAAICGGAAGADTLFAETAVDAAVSLLVYLPNRYYRDVYPDSIPQRLLDVAETVTTVVERPACLDWRRRWRTERWWRDNHERNHHMVATSTAACVVSPSNPLDLLLEDKGGTVACVKHLHGQRRRIKGVWWVPDWHRGPGNGVTWVPFDGGPVAARLEGLC